MCPSVNLYQADGEHEDNDLHYDSEGSDDSDDDVVIPKRKAQTLNPYQTQGNFTAPDDRPITPMKNTMIYDREHSSLDFKDGRMLCMS